MRDILKERAEIDRAIEGATLCTALAETAERHGRLPALNWREAAGWRSLSWAGYREQVRLAAYGLQAHGFTGGGFAVLLCGPRPEAGIADMACVHAGGTAVSLYPTFGEQQLTEVCHRTQATLAVVENPLAFERLNRIRGYLPGLRLAVLLEGASEVNEDWVLSWEEILESGASAARRAPGDFDRWWKPVAPDHLLTISFSSGSTGVLKGVMHTHRSVLWQAESMRRADPSPAGARTLAQGSLARAGVRFWDHYLPICSGWNVHFGAPTQSLPERLAEVRPQRVFADHKIWERMYASLSSAVAAGGADAAGALESGRRVEAAHQAGGTLSPELVAEYEAGETARSGLRAGLGLDECRSAVSSGGPLAVEILALLSSAGVPLSEAWGQAEVGPAVGWSGPERGRWGWVGPPLPGVELRLEPDGEIMVRAGSVMAGYFKDPTRTGGVLDPFGWLHTGVVGQLSPDGRLRVAGPEADLIATTAGHVVSPARVESLLRTCPLIGQACVIGDRRPYLTAVLVLEPEPAREWARRREIEASVVELASHIDVLAELETAIRWANSLLPPDERVTRFSVLPVEWEPGLSPELTHTGRLRRAVVLDRFAPAIDSMYGQAGDHPSFLLVNVLSTD
jgi:long-chain acyl-CoA synthetase